MELEVFITYVFLGMLCLVAIGTPIVSIGLLIYDFIDTKSLVKKTPIWQWKQFNEDSDITMSLDTVLFMESADKEDYDVYFYQTCIVISKGHGYKSESKKIGLSYRDFRKYQKLYKNKEKMKERQRALAEQKDALEFIQGCLDDIQSSFKKEE